MGYTIKEMGKIIGRKPAMIYNYFNENEETKSFYYSHREMGANGGYIYDDEALERLKIKVGVSNGVAGGISQNEDGENLKHSPAHSVRADEELEKAKAELEDIKGKYAELQAEFEKVEAERKELLEQNGNLLLLLSQEKAEKQKLLPPPHKSIGERIRSIFHRPPTDAG